MIPPGYWVLPHDTSDGSLIRIPLFSHAHYSIPEVD